MQKLIRYIFSCDYLKGFTANTEDFLLSTRINLFRILGKSIADKNKQKRLKCIQTANEAASKPLVISIILPVFNAANTLQQAITSIQEQIYPHWELLIIDDGSTDDSITVIKKLASVDSRIKLYKNNVNMGAAYARNVGLYHALGDYITFHDADDCSHIERLEYQLATLLQKPETKLVVTQYVRVNNKNEVLILNGRKKRNYISGMMFHRELIDTVGYFKPLKISEDSEYYERMVAAFGKQSRKILCKTLYYALFNPDSLLFSNAKVTIKGNRIDYKIIDTEFVLLESMRREHKLIRSGELSPYQAFTLDKDTASYNHE